MRTILPAFAAIALTSACVESREPIPEEAPAADTIVTFGHGSFLGASGKRLHPSAELFRDTQRAYIARLEQAAGGLGLADEAAAARAEIRTGTADDFLADALYIDWLVEHAPPAEHATLKTVNAAMRNHYRDAAGISARLTWNGGQKYIDECEAAGVPIPPPMYRESKEDWKNLGVFDQEVLSDDLIAELWMYRSESPAGICLALPRYRTVDGDLLEESDDVATDEVELLGLICLGTTTNKACFWDNPVDVTFTRGVEVPITSFVGGFDLEKNGQGTCTDCHAGENPFVVHPGKDPFAAFRDSGSTFGTAWYEPIVHPDWPQNPGPTRLLDAVPSMPRRCDECHDAGRMGGRLPAVSRALPGYCGFVLRSTTFEDEKRTMPLGGDPADFAAHIEALKRACDTEPVGDTFEFFGGATSGASFLSRPSLIGPLYACAQRVAVSGAVLDANVKLTVESAGTTTTYEQPARNPGQIVFDLSAPLEIDDVVTVKQSAAGGMGSGSDSLTVRDHHLDYPMGLPAPAVDPTLIHECANVIAVRHVPGAELTVTVNDDFPVTYWTAGGWSGVWPGKAPFEVGDDFRAQITMCPGEPASPWSEPGEAVAVSAPAALSAATFDPPRTFPGQELVSLGNLTHGSTTVLTVTGTAAGAFQTPISWFPYYDLATSIGRRLVEGETVSAQQKLCEPGPVTTLPPTAECKELPAPVVERALAGTDYVVVASSVPGARVRVYDNSRIEIGDGSGTVIRLARSLVAGEALRAVQQVGNCTSQRAHRVTVAD